MSETEQIKAIVVDWLLVTRAAIDGILQVLGVSDEQESGCPECGAGPELWANVDGSESLIMCAKCHTFFSESEDGESKDEDPREAGEHSPLPTAG